MLFLCLRAICRNIIVRSFSVGDLILLRHIQTEADIEAMIGRIFEALKTPLVLNQQEIQNNLSIGISIFTDCSQNLDSLIIQADCAMYKAKKIEGNSYCFLDKT